MVLPKKYDFNDYDNYLTDPNPTTSAEAQDYFRNMDMLVTAMVDTFLWQPGTNYANGDVVKSPSMPNGVEAVCVAENGGKSSNVEPQWGNVGGENIADGTCFWKLRWQHWSKEIATQAQAEAGIDNTTGMTPLRTKNAIDKQRPIKTFTSLAQLGLPNTCTPEDIAVAMPVGSQLLTMVYGYSADGNPQNPNLGVDENAPLIVEKTSDNMAIFTWGNYHSPQWAGVYAGWASTKFSGWRRLAERDRLSMPATQYIWVTLPLEANSATQTTSLVYTAPCDGWLRIEAFKGSALNNFRIIAIPETYWNGVAMALNSPYSSADNKDNMIFSIPMAKGNSLKIEYINLRKLEGVFLYAQSEV